MSFEYYAIAAVAIVLFLFLGNELYDEFVK